MFQYTIWMSLKGPPSVTSVSMYTVYTVCPGNATRRSVGRGTDECLGPDDDSMVDKLSNH